MTILSSIIAVIIALDINYHDDQNGLYLPQADMYPKLLMEKWTNLKVPKNTPKT
jgi:hypothetical protein